ncbi:flavodoxin [Bacteroidales bacterium SW299]|nr:flavodoxin [Bacteroidales bacterium SW299]
MNKASLFLSVAVSLAVVFTVYAYASRTCTAESVTNDRISAEAAQPAAVPVKGKVLVVYFTSPETDGVDTSSGASRIVADGKLYGNTEYVADLISQKTGGDLFQIKTANAYPGTHKELLDASKREIDAKARPKLTSHIQRLKDYDVIFVGFPNWWYDMPMPLYSFFDAYDFTGKTLIPFCTHAGSRFSQAEKTIAALEKGAKMQKGLAISRKNLGEAETAIQNWLQRMGFGK